MKQAPVKPKITFGKFSNVDMRVARIISAPIAEGTRHPCRILNLDVGHLGKLRSVGQFVLVPEEQLLGKKVIICCNLGSQTMGPYISDVLILGAPHPNSPEDQNQATPLWVDDFVELGTCVF